MNKLLLSISLLTLWFNSSNAQIVLTNDDLPTYGTQYNKYYRVDKTNSFGTLTSGASGPDVAWNFETIKGGKNDSLWYSDPALTKFTKDFPGSTIAEESLNEITYYSIITKNTTIYKVLGKADTVVSKLAYQLLALPLTYKTLDSVSVFYQQIAPDSTTAILTALKRVNNVDSWGAITTPIAVYNALRIYSTITLTVTPQIKDRNGRFVPDSKKPRKITNSREYAWWAKGIGKEVFKITYAGSTGDSITKASWYMGKTPLPITANNTMLEEASINIGPNPGNGNISINNAYGKLEGYKIELYDLIGKEKYSGTIKGNDNTFNFSNFPDGMYNIKLTAPTGQSFSKKLTFIK